MKRVILSIGLLLTVCASVWAQEAKHEVSVQGSGLFTKETSDLGITNKPTHSGGFLVGYRFNVNKWLGVEADYDYFRNSQKYITSTDIARLKTNVHAVTGTAVLKLPTSGLWRPYALVGGGTLTFDPRDTGGVNSQTKGAFVYGGGVDVAVLKHVALRGQYRGFVYKVPDFDVSSLSTDKYTHSAVPSVGLAFTF